MVLEEKTWNYLPGANRRAVEAAADGLGISIDELRVRLRVAAQEEETAPCAIGVEEAEEVDTRRKTEGDEETVVVNATVESSEEISTDQNV